MAEQFRNNPQLQQEAMNVAYNNRAAIGQAAYENRENIGQQIHNSVGGQFNQGVN